MKRTAWITGIAIAFFFYSCGGGGPHPDTTPPAFTSPASAVVPENSRLVMLLTTDDGSALLSLGGPDAPRFRLQESGALLFKTAPDYEHPADADGDNRYRLRVTAADWAGNMASQELDITVTDVAEKIPDSTPPAFTSPSSVKVAENRSVVLRVTTDDAGAKLGLEGSDAALFTFKEEGTLCFLEPPDYESPSDADGDNRYEIRIAATDRVGNRAWQELSVTVTDAAEPPVVPFAVLQTGQSKSYDEIGAEVSDGSVGDDGYYRSGAGRSYSRDLSNGIVTDKATGLMWQDNVDAAAVTRPWVRGSAAMSGSYGDTSGDTAATYCAQLELGPYRDWRLPTVRELKSLVDYSRQEPSLDPVFENVAWDYYWSVTTCGVFPAFACGVTFAGGESEGLDKSALHYVRCVRDAE